ncbi:MAG: histidine kinase [Sphingobacteriaceae bacterium]|jgi:signal transduction histidine kinase|nr:histidine kinase [Sphingobacteriaceae bacterium]
MKLQHKLALYNTFTKVAIIAIVGILIAIFIGKVSVSHLQNRLVEKRNKLIANLSDAEISGLMQQQSSFTDYNLLKEEYIVLTQARQQEKRSVGPLFTQEQREIDGDEEEYQILTDYFSYGGQLYRLEIGESTLVTRQFEKTILAFTLVVLALSVGLSIIADLSFTRVILAPFYKIIDQKLNRVDDPLQFSFLPEKTTTDDFKLLDSSISTLMKKISAQMLSEKQFITNVSHELLTPISILRTRLENMLNDEGLSPEGQVKLAASLKTVSRLKSIINSLLLISKIENKQFNKANQLFIPTLIHEICEELQDRLAEKNISFDIRLSHEFTATGNQALLHILCSNLVNNAIKYNRQDGMIFIADEYGEKRYTLIIRDEGVGMDAMQIEKAFERFEKLNSTDAGSHGLGLAIARSIAVFHEFPLTITSEPGKGTTASIAFGTS